jgi:hypothetical protein
MDARVPGAGQHENNSRPQKISWTSFFQQLLLPRFWPWHLAAHAGLAPGKLAGTKNGQIVRDPGFHIMFGLGLIGMGIAVAASLYQKTAASMAITRSKATSP